MTKVVAKRLSAFCSSPSINHFSFQFIQRSLFKCPNTLQDGGWPGGAQENGGGCLKGAADALFSDQL